MSYLALMTEKIKANLGFTISSKLHKFFQLGLPTGTIKDGVHVPVLYTELLGLLIHQLNWPLHWKAILSSG